VLAALKSLYTEQMARPGLIGLFINPFYFARRELAVAVRELAPRLGGRVLDVGCGDRPYEHMIPAGEYVGLEIDTPENRARARADAYYDGRRFPFEDGAFDAVLCNQVLEHVFEPEAFVGEIARVLKTGGRLLLTVPFVWDEHEQPRDYARYSSFGLRALLEKHGLRLEQQRKTAADLRALFQMANAYLYKVTVTRNPYANLLAALVLMAPVNLAGTLLAWVAPANRDFYLDNVVLAEKAVR
jgi:SAM-dependent methyltransferase